MPPLSLVVRSKAWLRAIHNSCATFTAAANFGLDLCLRRIDFAAHPRLDLGSLRMVVNGAGAGQRFIAIPCGFGPGAAAPV
jgi:hypothetical protein